MTLNLGKLQAITIHSKKNINTQEIAISYTRNNNIERKILKVKSSKKSLIKLNFNSHVIADIFRSAANELNVFVELIRFNYDDKNPATEEIAEKSLRLQKYRQHQSMFVDQILQLREQTE